MRGEHALGGLGWGVEKGRNVGALERLGFSAFVSVAFDG